MMTETPQDGIVDQGLGLMPQDTQQEPPEQQLPQQPVEEKINPAWSELLNQVPENLRGAITPHLKQWDQNFQQQVQQVHSQYEPYKPFIEQGVEPDALNNAMLIMQSLEQDPEKFAQALIEHYGIQLGEQGQQSQQDPLSDEESEFDITQHPEFQRYSQMTETMAQALLAQNQAAEEAQVEQQIDQEMAAAKQKYGDFDEGFVFQYAYTNECDIDTAVQAYNQFAQNLIQNYRPPGANAPTLMGGGGGLPSQATPVKNMTGKERRALMVQTLTNLENSGG